MANQITQQLGHIRTIVETIVVIIVVTAVVTRFGSQFGTSNFAVGPNHPERGSKFLLQQPSELLQQQIEMWHTEAYVHWMHEKHIGTP